MYCKYITIANEVFIFYIYNKLCKEVTMKEDDSLMFDYEFIDRLIVGIGEVSEITGVPTRQIRYWEEKGIISSLTTGESKNRRYDYKTIKRMLLIKELMDEGYTLDASAHKIEKRMETMEAAFKKFRDTQTK